MRKRGTTTMSIFLGMVIPEPTSGCWLWYGAIRRDGYGTCGMGGKENVAAHRAAWKIFRGEPGDLFVCHKCDVPTCVNPDHLFLGTNRDNTLDSMRKGRWKKPPLGPGAPKGTVPWNAGLRGTRRKAPKSVIP